MTKPPRVPSEPLPPGKPKTSQDPDTPLTPKNPDAPSKQKTPSVKEDTKNEINMKEPDKGSAKRCDNEDKKFWRNVKIFEGKLSKQEWYLRLVSCYRDPNIQQKWHLARMITWKESKIKQFVNVADSDEIAHEIVLRALNEFKILQKLNSDEDAKKLASKVIHDAGIGDLIPVLPGVDEPCPCSCNWPRSKHTYNPALAIDANIIRKTTLGLREEAIVRSTTDNSSEFYTKINKLAEESGLFWGINFTEIPTDPIHFELK